MINSSVALVIRKRDSCDTVSTSGELFMIVLTRARGKFADPEPLDMALFKVASRQLNYSVVTASISGIGPLKEKKNI